MPESSTGSLLDAATDIALRAAELSLRWFQDADLDVETKGDGTPVTAADRAVERAIREQIEQQFPSDAVLGEEEGFAPGSSGRTWLIDPIDGTKAFTRGVPTYSTLLAAVDDAGPMAGVVVFPALGEALWAGRGLGTTWRDRHGRERPATVSATGDLRGSVLATSGTWYWPSALAGALADAGVQVTTWGDAYGYALAATGRIDAMVDTVANPWDLAAPRLVVDEAGGRFTDLAGVTSHDSGHALGSNGALHEGLLAVIAGPLGI